MVKLSPAPSAVALLESCFPDPVSSQLCGLARPPERHRHVPARTPGFWRCFSQPPPGPRKSPGLGSQLGQDRWSHEALGTQMVTGPHQSKFQGTGLGFPGRCAFRWSRVLASYTPVLRVLSGTLSKQREAQMSIRIAVSLPSHRHAT